MSAFEIIGWVGLAVAAGFLGYFGRYAAMKIIERIRREKHPDSGSAAQEIPVDDKDRLKTGKKLSKQAVKQAKKK